MDLQPCTPQLSNQHHFPPLAVDSSELSVNIGTEYQVAREAPNAAREAPSAVMGENMMEGFPEDEILRLLGGNWKPKLGGFGVLTVIILCAVLIPSSLGTIGSSEVALAYDNYNSILGTEVLQEGLKSKPTFGSFIKWPITNQALELALQCNSRDAIVIDLVVEFLYIPAAGKLRDLTLRYVNFDGYLQVVTSLSRSSLRNACGLYGAREFQTRRSDVSKSMEEILSKDLRESLSTTLMTLNLKNIDRPQGYQAAVEVSEAALADISLARQEEEQKLIKAKTVLEQAMVDANKTMDNADSKADSMVATAVAGVKQAAEAGVCVIRNIKNVFVISNVACCMN
jgi:hypothetical protein